MSDFAEQRRPTTAPAGPAPAPAGPAPAPAAPAGDRHSYGVEGKNTSNGLVRPSTKEVVGADGTRSTEAVAGKWPEHQAWQAWGSGAGDRKGDRPDDKGVVKNATVAAPKVAQADLRGIATTTTGQKADAEGGGAYHDSLYGSVTEGGFKPSAKYDPMKGTSSLDLYSARAAAGMREQVGYRGMAKSEGGWGSAVAKGDAYALGELGADAGFKANTKDGLVASANASGRLGVGFSGDADYKTQGLKVAGVDDPLTAGVGVHADGFAGVKAGAGGRVGFGRDFIGAEGSIGAFAGVEAQADAHANIGPMRGKVGVSGMAGVGAGADGGIVYEDGKLRIGGKLYAALGYGGSVSGEVSIDVKQAGQLAMAAGKKAYQMADGDGDGRLSLNDPATHAANAAKGGAALLDRGVSGAIGALDADGNGKFGVNDLKVRMNQVGDTLGEAKDRVLAGGQQLLNKGRQALDRDGDGKLSFGDVRAGAGELKDAALKKVGEVGDLARRGAKGVHDAIDHDGDGKLEMSDVTAHLGDAGKAVLDTGKGIAQGVMDTGARARDYAMEKGSQAAHALHDAADVDGDGKLSLHDGVALGQRAYHGIESAGREVASQAKDAIKDVHDGLDLNNDGKLDSKDLGVAGKRVADTARAVKGAAVDTFNKTVAAGQRGLQMAKDKAVQLGQAAHHAADRDGDGQLGWNDVRAGASQAKDAVVQRAQQVGQVAQQAGQAVHHAADRDGDGQLGWNDVRAGASQAKDAVVNVASQAYEGARTQVTQAASTLKEGIGSAASSVKNTWNKVTNFFSW